MKLVLRLSALALAIALFGFWVRHMVERDAAREATFDPNVPPLEHVPVVVHVDKDMREYLPAIREAFAVWNREVGCELLREAHPGEVPNATIGWADWSACGEAFASVNKEAAASTYFCRDGSAEVRMQRLSDIQSAFMIAMHEAGHLLRMAHDQGGIMAPTTHRMDPPIVPSRADRRALRARWCP